MGEGGEGWWWLVAWKGDEKVAKRMVERGKAAARPRGLRKYLLFTKMHWAWLWGTKIDHGQALLTVTGRHHPCHPLVATSHGFAGNRCQ